MLIHWECLEELSKMEDESIDLVVTSPPYDNLRTYNWTNDWNFEVFKPIAKELSRVLKDWWVVVWVVWDATVKWSETGTSFKQAIYFKEECWLNLHDTMIYYSEKPPLTHNRYEQKFEYMFILSKWKPKNFNPIKEKCKYAWTDTSKKTFRHNGNDLWICHTPWKVKDYKIKWNIWTYSTWFWQSYTEEYLKWHPAVFPEKLAEDHIKSWSNEWDIVLDPFMWSWTTWKMALLNNREFIWIERVEEYFNISKQRLWL